jgi:type IV secretion system protein VirB10
VNTRFSSPVPTSADPDSQEGLNRHDLDEGTQPADINAIGQTASRFPVGKVVFFGLIAAAVVFALFLLGKSWLTSKFTTPARPSQQVGSTSPSEGAQSAKRPRLPDANTPLEITFAAAAASNPGASPAIPPTLSGPGAKAADAPCPSTALVDKRSGQAVRDAQGQPVMVDCKGVILSTTRIPAPTGTAANASSGAYGSIPAPGASAMGQAVPAPVDRYSGDTALASKKTPSSPIPGMPAFGTMGSPVGTSIGTLPPPPVSSADLEARLKRLMTPAVQPAGSGTNPVLASPTANASGNPQGAMGGLLSPTSTPKALAMRTFDPNLTIPKGDAINCAMTTRVVTEISGFTSCIVIENVYSANGKVLLIERMSEIQGEYTAVGQPGQRRVYVLWSRVRKPGGTTIDIASPSTDSLGAAGIDGIVDNRWFERIGSAYMLSIFKDFLAANAASTAGGTAGANTATGSALYQNSINTSNSLAEKVLAQSMNIKPVVYAHQGERIAIYVARDLDFSGIYQVTPVERKP